MPQTVDAAGLLEHLEVVEQQPADQQTLVAIGQGEDAAPPRDRRLQASRPPPGVVEGGGHAWPGSTFELPPELEDLLGVTTHEISANDLMWDFFVAHPMPADAEPSPSPTTPPQPTAPVADIAAPTSGSGPSPDDNSGWPAGVIAVLAGLIALGGAAVYAGRRLRS